jgi:2-oxo-4-hydroxy-4-carboxy-5-ureidoimidazoline decarboxylase
MVYKLDELNQMSQSEFVAALGAVFEATPAIAHRAWGDRPFTSRADLHAKMAAVVQALDSAAQLTLICAHPDLGARVKMAPTSVQEQAGLGLDRLSPEEYAQFQSLNTAYKAQFGFPFIIAVRNHTKASILAAFQQRLGHPSDIEQHQALAEIIEIARFRLEDTVQGD